MPSSASIARRSSRAHRSITEFGSPDHVVLKASGLYQSGTVQDRIKQWQAHGAATAPAPDDISVRSIPRSARSTPEPVEDKVTDQVPSLNNPKRKSAKTKAEQGNEANRVRSSSTPRKRVVSDEHWKVNRWQNEAIVPSEVDEEENATQKSISPRSQAERSRKQARTEREERRRRRVDARSRKNSEAETQHRLRSTSRPESVVNAQRSAYEEPAAFKESKQKLESSLLSYTSTEDFEGTIIAPDEDDRHYEKTKYAETLGRPPPSYQDAPLKSKKGSFMNKTREVLGIADPVPIFSNRLPSIEAWLEEQPDPVVESVSPKVRFEDEKSTPRSGRVQRVSTSSRKDKEQSKSLRDADHPVDSITDTGREEVEAVGHVKEPLSPSPSPVSLKRRHATSRQKRHTINGPPPEAQQLSDKNPHDQDGQRTWTERGPTRLSTIPSVETLQQTQAQEQYEVKGNVTTHEEMMSVLSRPSLRKSTRRKRSVKATTQQQSKDKDAITQIMENLTEDETKYSRELRTLVDGVIPVLLQCVLSKSDAVAAAEFFTSSKEIGQDLSFNRSIINMGIALERLKSLHNRIPLHNVNNLLSWCQTAHKAYSDYLKAWRLTLQDVVVNLAPLEGSDENDEVMARDANGDIVNAEGEPVDIAYLLKRPLVNIRKLGRALCMIEEELPNDLVARKVALEYRELTTAAKNKHQQEKGRLEDENAANTDPTRCRDLKNMEPLPGVAIDPTRRVRARDEFDMTMFHSGGQRMDCRIEIILRENQHPAPDGGDLLIRGVEEKSKWLLFPPIDSRYISVRREESPYDLVVMIRGRASMGKEWHELLALKADDPASVSEWMLMLGTNPLPPRLNHARELMTTNVEVPDLKEPSVPVAPSTLRRAPSVETIDIPLGEPSVLGVIATKALPQLPVQAAPSVHKPSQLNLGGGLVQRHVPQHRIDQLSSVTKVSKSVYSSDQSVSNGSTGSSQTFTPSSLAPIEHVNLRVEPKVQLQPLPHRYPPQTIPFPSNPSTSSVPLSTKQSEKGKKVIEKVQAKEIEQAGKDEKRARALEVAITVKAESSPPSVPTQAPTQAPTESLPKITKVRGSPSSTPLTDSIRDTWSSISGLGRKTVSQPTSPVAKEKVDVNVLPDENGPTQRGRRKSDVVKVRETTDADTPPSPPQHKQMPVLTPRSRNVPTLRPSEAQIKMDQARGRVSHSPLRKEYRPSSASGSDHSGSESPYTSDDDSQTSEEEDYARNPPKAPVGQQQTYQTLNPVPHSAPTAGTRTLAPSDSASQGPYRRVPSSADRPGAVQKKAVAMICSWNDKGLWEPLVDEYCQVIVSPGLMEAFLMGDSRVAFQGDRLRPLAAYELTPMVPLRKPTGLDISIRSPSTPDSQIKTSTNIMFRSRTPIECEVFYQMINWARCNNPTYIQLARDRPQPQPTVTFSNQEAPRPRSWFSFGRGVKRQNSYRIGNVPPSSMGESQATANTVSSAMSALKRLTKSSSFNVNRSSVVHRPGMNTISTYSSSNGTGIGSEKSTPPPSQMGFVPGNDGPNVPPSSDAALRGGGMVHNMKVKLFVRQDQGWAIVGPSRLTVLPAVKHSESPGTSRPGSSGSDAGGQDASRRTSTNMTVNQSRRPRLASADYTPHRLHGGGREKRVVITDMSNPSRVIFDVTLGESCFERINNLGIAVQVWTSHEEIKNTGGVLLGQNTKYLFQFYHAKECAWVFDLVGKYRYNF